MEIQIDFSELKGLQRWYGDQPRLVRIATGRMLNDFAFGTRTLAIREINDTMIVRNPKFVAGRIRVTKARESAPTNRQIAITGSMATARFSGWTEQELGTPQVRTRFASLAGRGGSETKPIRHVVRLKPRNSVVTREDYQMKSGHTNRQFFAAAKRKKENRLLKVNGKLFKRKRLRFELVQVLKRPKAPKRNMWLKNSGDKYFRGVNLNAKWARITSALVRPPK